MDEILGTWSWDLGADPKPIKMSRKPFSAVKDIGIRPLKQFEPRKAASTAWIENFVAVARFQSIFLSTQTGVAAVVGDLCYELPI